MKQTKRKLVLPVSGSVVIEDRRSVNGWEPEAGDLCFVGYIVHIDPTG